MNVYFIFFLLLLVLTVTNVIAHHYLKKRWAIWLIYGISCLSIIGFMLSVSAPTSYVFGDYNKSYYTGGRLVIENPKSLYTDEVAFANIPIFGFLFTPFAFLPQKASYLLLAILSTIVVGFTCYLLVRPKFLTPLQRILIVSLFVVFGPLYNSLREGNSTHFAFPLLLGGLLCIQQHRQFSGGILLGIAALTKIPLMLFGVYYIARRQWQVVIGFVAIVLLIVAMSLLVFGIDLHISWFNYCILPFLKSGTVIAYNNQSLDAFLGRLFTDNSLMDWNRLQLGINYRLLRYAIVSLLVSSTIWVFWKAKQPTTNEERSLEFAVVLCLAIMLSSVSWTHYYLYLLIPLSLLVSDRLWLPQGRYWVALLGFSILLIIPPPREIGSANLVTRFLASHYFLGATILLLALLVARWQSSSRLFSSSLAIAQHLNLAKEE